MGLGRLLRDAGWLRGTWEEVDEAGPESAVEAVRCDRREVRESEGKREYFAGA